MIAKDFFNQPTMTLAKKLLGLHLIHASPQGITAGRIVETEAYLKNDPACHASRGQTKRNTPMFGPPGTAYIYFIYGMYHCFNVVTAPKGIGEAVLIRALEPLEGLDLMTKRRHIGSKKPALKDLCSGPSKLVIAMGIDKTQHQSCALIKPPLYLHDAGDPKPDKNQIIATPRIGIREATTELLRFVIKDNPFVSRKLGDF